jgi:hypothetical protein
MRSEMQRRLDAVRARLAPLYSREEIDLWLLLSHPLLMGERPIRLVMGNRMEPIWRIIDQLESGAFR